MFLSNTTICFCMFLWSILYLLLKMRVQHPQMKIKPRCGIAIYVALSYLHSWHKWYINALRYWLLCIVYFYTFTYDNCYIDFMTFVYSVKSGNDLSMIKLMLAKLFKKKLVGVVLPKLLVYICWSSSHSKKKGIAKNKALIVSIVNCKLYSPVVVC